MDDEKQGFRSATLVPKLLLASGLVLCMAGAFVILFGSIVIGVILIAAGVIDVAMSVLLPRLTGRNG